LSGFDPHFLTAFHCLDINGVGGFDEEDRSKIKNCVFRFHYQTNEPMCPGNSQGDQGDWLTFTGSTLLATFRPADAALFRLNGTINGQKGLALLGWDRSDNAASSGVCIHHPRGDAKKISTFDKPTERRDNFKYPNSFPPPGNLHWLVARWSQGITEKGSSGSPLINEDHRLVGVFSAGVSNCETSGLGDIFGRFDNAWTGGGTDETRLSTWLGGRNVQETVNTLQVPWVNTEGSDAICTINKTIVLANPIASKQLSWSVAPAALFANSAGATTTGIGTDAVLRAANATSQGQAILTYLLSENGCEPVTIEKRLWVGIPSLPLTIPSGNVPIALPIGQSQVVRLISSTGAERLVANWSASGAVSVEPVPVATEQGRFRGNYTGLGHWRVATSNACGVSSNNYGRFNVSGDCTTCPKIVMNNPTQNYLSIEVLETDLLKTEENSSMENTLELIDIMGNIVLRQPFHGNVHQLELNNVLPGSYLAKIKVGGKQFTKKIIILK
jgi:hypothetical protein